MMTINEMIIMAITTDSRKRKARYQTELENLGYKVSKNGSWYIRNPKTGRFIEKEYNDDCGIRSSRGYIRYGCVWSKYKHKYVKKPISVINFAGLLDEPEKHENYFDENSTDRLKSALRDRKYHKKNLDSALSEYQTKIDNITKEYQRMLKDAENSYKWSVEYHTKSLSSAEKRISELLRK